MRSRVTLQNAVPVMHETATTRYMVSHISNAVWRRRKPSQNQLKHRYYARAAEPPYEKPNAECKTCRDREKHRGNSIVKPRKCSACGCPIENLKPGCKTCSNRNKNRKFSGRPLLTPLPIPEPPPTKPRPVLPLVVEDPGLMSYLAARRERLGKRKENKKND